MRMKKGISLITLAVTILVMAIITTVVIMDMTDTDLVNKSTSTVNKYNSTQQAIFDSVKATAEEIEKLENGRDNEKEIIHIGSLTGNNGVINLPMDLNDTTKQYILEISSNMYTGKVLLNTYGVNDVYTGTFGINSTANFAVESRVLLELQKSSDETRLTQLFGASGINFLTYIDEGGMPIIQYNTANIGSEVTITKITKVDREYTMFAKLVINLLEGKYITSYDMKDALLYCINSNNLGYAYMDELLEDPEVVIDEAFEKQTLNNIVNTRMQDLRDLEYSITDQTILLAYQYLICIAENGQNITDFYTIANIFEENEWLNEFYYRVFADAIVGFTVLFSDYILMDLNQDGVIGGEFNVSVYDHASLLPSGNMRSI